MVFRRACLPLRQGFSLLEVILVVGLVGAVAGVGIPLYRDYQIRNDLNLATEQVTQGLARARLRSQAAESDGNWGFYAPAGVLYKGDSYALRDPLYDETYPMPSTIAIQGLMDVNYGKIVGIPNTTGDITLTTINDETRNVLIEVKMESIAVVTADRFTICHNPGPTENTLSIPDNAWPAHQAHGDAFGACVGDASSSAASSVAVSSTPASSVASSTPASGSSSSSSAPTACTDRFRIEADGTITLLGSLSLTYTAVGSDITFGEGGPEVAVTLKYSKNGGGNPWSNLFSGDDIDGGEVTTTTTLASGSEIVTSFRGYYRQSRWLMFDQTYRTDDQSGHILVLRDGDPLPDYPAFDNQEDLEEYLQDIVDENGYIDISDYEIVYLVEFGDLEGESADYQDAVVRLRFNAPSC